MADFTALKTAIQNAIKQNGNEEITGNLLQEVLLAIVTTLGDGSINDLITALGSEATTRSQADGTLQQNIDAEAQARGNADTALGGRIDGVISSIEAINNAIENGYVYAGIATPSSTPTTGKVFYLALTAGTYTNFGDIAVTQGINILKYNGSAWSLDAFVGIDDTPTPSSNNLIKSGGVFNDIMTNGSAFDLTAYNNGTTYADLDAALTALNALPAAYKKGGMSLKYVQSSDNKYVQFRLMAQNFTTDVTQWQGVDDEPTAGSDNLVKSDGVFDFVTFPVQLTQSDAEYHLPLYINADSNIWGNNQASSGSSYLFKVLPNDVIKITSRDDIGAVYAIVDNVDNIQAGDTVSYAEGDGCVVLSAGESKTVKIHTNSYLYICYSTSFVRYPKSISLSKDIKALNDALNSLKNATNNLCKEKENNKALKYADGETTSMGDTVYKVSDYIEVSDIYAIIYSLKSGETAHCVIAAYDTDKQYIQSNSVKIQRDFTAQSGVWHKGENTKYIRIAFQPTNENTGSAFVISPKAANLIENIDNEVTFNSKNLIESGAVYDEVYDAITLSQESSTWISGSSWNGGAGLAKKVEVTGLSKVYFNTNATTLYIAFLKTYNTSVAPDFATGYSSMVPVSNNDILNIPSDAKYLTVNCGNNSFSVSLHEKINKFKSGQKVTDVKILQENNEPAINDIYSAEAINKYISAPFILNKYNATAIIPYYINASTNIWTLGQDDASYLYKVKKDDLVSIKSSSTIEAVVAFITDLNIVEGEIANYSQGNSTYMVPVGETIEFAIENDCYMYVLNRTSVPRYPQQIIRYIRPNNVFNEYISYDSTFVGAPISLSTGKAKFYKWKTFTSVEHQSFVIYGDYFISFVMGGNIGYIFRISTEELLAQFSLPQSDGQYSHANTACIGNKFAIGNTDLPLIYLSMWDGNGGCLVLDIHLDGTCNLVQTIKYSNMPIDKFGGNLGDWVVDTDRNKIYSCKYLLNTGNPEVDAVQVEGNRTMFCEFDLPDLSDGEVVTFTESDIISNFSTEPMVINQDKFYKNGKIYISAGSGHDASKRNTLKLFVVDLQYQNIASIASLNIPSIIVEPEGLDCYGYNIVISDYENNSDIYKIDFF